jgi:hypothetical protein
VPAYCSALTAPIETVSGVHLWDTPREGGQSTLSRGPFYSRQPKQKFYSCHIIYRLPIRGTSRSLFTTLLFTTWRRGKDASRRGTLTPVKEMDCQATDFVRSQRIASKKG